MMFRESLRISIHHDPKAEEDKIKKVKAKVFVTLESLLIVYFSISSKNKKRNVTRKSSSVLRRNT
jgi:hypothetical protein